jgi:hypothetical protein
MYSTDSILVHSSATMCLFVAYIKLRPPQYPKNGRHYSHICPFTNLGLQVLSFQFYMPLLFSDFRPCNQLENWSERPLAVNWYQEYWHHDWSNSLYYLRLYVIRLMVYEFLTVSSMKLSTPLITVGSFADLQIYRYKKSIPRPYNYNFSVKIFKGKLFECEDLARN